MIDSEHIGRVVAIALRGPGGPGGAGPMRLVDQVVARADEGLDGDLPGSPERGVTLLSAGQWEQVTIDLGVDLPWHTRRANVLVEGGGLLRLIGRVIRVGGARVRINAETKPCALMDRLHAGLKAALVPDGRGGVYGRIIESGTIRTGDDVMICRQREQ